MNRERLIEGIWERDATTWTGGDEAHWLGWLDEPLHVQEGLGSIVRLAEDLQEQVDDVVLCGMGGSSLAPEVLRRSFAVDRFHVLDTTHPRAIRALEETLDLQRTLFVSSSKSGTTLETRSHTDYFWEKTRKNAQLFCAVTDPGSELERLARERGFRAVFAGEPSIGGRYSALSPFGIVPAVLMGVDASRLLTLYLLAGAFGGLIGGWLADRAGRDRVIIASLLLAAPFCVLLGVQAEVGPAFVAATAVSGLLLNGSFVVLAVRGQESMPGSLGMVSGLMLGLSIGLGGLAVTPMGVIAEQVGIPPVFVAAGALAILGAFLMRTVPQAPAHAAAVPLAVAG